MPLSSTKVTKVSWIEADWPRSCVGSMPDGTISKLAKSPEYFEISTTPKSIDPVDVAVKSRALDRSGRSCVRISLTLAVKK